MQALHRYGLVLACMAVVDLVVFGVVALVRPDLAATTMDTLGHAVRFGAWEAPSYLPLLVVVLALDAALLGWSRSAAAALVGASRSARLDLVALGIRVAGFTVVVEVIATGGVKAVVGGLLHDALAPVADRGLASGAAIALGFILVVDFFDYWAHRWSHEIDALWQAHAFHHSATEFTIATATRVHPLETAFRGLVTLVPVVIAGAPILTWFVIRKLLEVLVLLQHSMLEWDYGRIGRHLVVSPVFHRVHHSPEPEHWDRNYGGYFAVWDHLFGTAYRGDRLNAEVGVSDNWYERSGVVSSYVTPFARVARSVGRSVRTGTWRTPTTIERRRRRNAAAVSPS